MYTLPYTNPSTYGYYPYYANTTDERFCAFPFLGIGLGLLGGFAAGALVSRPYGYGYGYPQPYPMPYPYPVPYQTQQNQVPTMPYSTNQNLATVQPNYQMPSYQMPSYQMQTYPTLPTNTTNTQF